jgi:hypothetical protein
MDWTISSSANTKNRGQLASIERRIVERRREKRALAAANV